MDYFNNKADKKEKKVKETLPEWVSEENASYAAYKATEKLKGVKISYIKEHTKKSHFKIKKNWHIFARRVAEDINIAVSTLISRSSYSDEYSKYLEEINSDLEALKNERIKGSEKNKSRGAIARNKDELVAEVTDLKVENKLLKEKNAIEQVEYAINMLHSNVADLLLLRQQPQSSKIIHLGKKKN